MKKEKMRLEKTKILDLIQYVIGPTFIGTCLANLMATPGQNSDEIWVICFPIGVFITGLAFILKKWGNN